MICKCRTGSDGKICGGNHILGGNMETNSKNIFWSFKKN
jgi:hypothetical protein